MFESDEDDLNEMEDNFDVDMPHRYSKDLKDCKDVTGIFRFSPCIENLFFSKQCLVKFLFLTFYSVLNSNRSIYFFQFFPFDLISNFD